MALSSSNVLRQGRAWQWQSTSRRGNGKAMQGDDKLRICNPSRSCG
nr:MAG TPA: hypothetical protein [Ackermannviridae sp.]